MAEKLTESMIDWSTDHLAHKEKYKVTERLSDWTNWTTDKLIDSLKDCLTGTQTDT